MLRTLNNPTNPDRNRSTILDTFIPLCEWKKKVLNSSSVVHQEEPWKLIPYVEPSNKVTRILYRTQEPLIFGWTLQEPLKNAFNFENFQFVQFHFVTLKKDPHRFFRCQFGGTLKDSTKNPRTKWFLLKTSSEQNPLLQPKNT